MKTITCIRFNENEHHEREVISELDKMKKANDEELSSMKNAIRSENKEMLSEFRDKINNLYRAKFMFLDNLCKLFYSSFSDDEELYALEEIVNSFKDEDFKLMCYWYAGFSPAAMCVLMKIDEISDIYKRKSRLFFFSQTFITGLEKFQKR